MFSIIRRNWRTLVLLVAATLLAAPAVAQDPRVSEVRRAALDWLVVVDAGNGSGSWNGAGKRFQQTMTIEQWNEGLAASRGQMGPLLQRSLYESKVPAQFNGMPPGEYAELLFRSSFAKRQSVGETISLEREADGQWRVIGYSLR
jgi:hypothetical protein